MPESPLPGSRRGLFSCLHSNCDDACSCSEEITDLLHHLLVDFYAEAFDRLPFEGMPAKDAENLLKTMRTGGVCVGLLDPVSNIILNTISLLPLDFQPQPDHQPPPRRRSKWLPGVARPDDMWYSISKISRRALVEFLVSYFGCLTDKQAARYLYSARADLALAVLLVEHDLYAAAADEPQLLNPASERTQAALKCAASRGWRPDVLLRLHTSPLPQQRILAAAPFLKPGARSLTLQDVHTVIDSLRYQESASLDLQVNLLPDGRGVVVRCRDLNADEGKLIRDTISSSVDNNGVRFDVFTFTVERHGDSFASLRDKESMITTFLEKVEKISQVRSFTSCGDACEYTESLKMRLHGTLHTLYLKAFTMLPSNVSRRLIRYILLAGHCYGPMDPVSNIIINSIWHSIVFPLPSSVDSEIQVAYDILDTLSMLRVEVRSLRGLIAIVKASSGCSTQLAMEHLCSNRCHLSEEMHTANGFATASEAAQHPQNAALGSFLSSLTPQVLDNLRPLLSTSNSGTLSSESLDQVESILTKEIRDTALPFASEEAELCKVAKDTLSIKKSGYNKFRLFIRSELAKVLKKYASEHPQKPIYVPSVICGVVETYSSAWDSYHVNFVATSESGADNQLFFAELNLPCQQSKPNFCRPLSYTYRSEIHRRYRHIPRFCTWTLTLVGPS